MTDKSLLHRFIYNRPHLSLAIVLGVMLGLLLPSSETPLTRVLIAWNAAVWAYLFSMMRLMARADHREVREIAARQDESAGVVLLALTAGAVFSLSAIIVELSQVSDLSERARALRYGFTALTVAGSWFLVGVLFCFHYAHLYYRAPATRRPLRFPEELVEPDYWDFLYFSFTIAVAVQTSDVQVMTRGMRKLVLGQSVLSFFFNLAILGLAINIAAGLLNH
jgi:uncharacterized membrane protein